MQPCSGFFIDQSLRPERPLDLQQVREFNFKDRFNRQKIISGREIYLWNEVTLFCRHNDKFHVHVVHTVFSDLLQGKNLKSHNKN